MFAHRSVSKVKANISSTIKTHLIRGALYVLVLLAVFVISLALGQQSSGNSAIDPKNRSFAAGQSKSEAAETQGSPTPFPESTAVVVWDQYNNAGTVVTLSGTFTDAPAMNSDLADDFDVQGYTWVVRWIVPHLRGDALLVGRSEAASALIYWNGKRYVWFQQGD